MYFHTQLFFFSFSSDHPDLHSFPTRRSSDLGSNQRQVRGGIVDDIDTLGRRQQRLARRQRARRLAERHFQIDDRQRRRLDRKSTRLNSSHSQISYAVFCLKKKKEQQDRLTRY